MKSFAVVLVFGLPCLCLPGCGPASDLDAPDGGASWLVVEPAGMSAEQTAQLERALAARDELFQTLKGRLMDALAQDGPAGAISVCKSAAPALAEQVSQQHELSIGRTSFRLRNPDNRPPVWARSLVERRVEQPAYLASGDRLAALLPIRVNALCLMCHGPSEGIPEPVSQALAEQYPGDQATGFQEGDLRGWFWVEVPAAEKN